jgi:hypothetical protein
MRRLAVSFAAVILLLAVSACASRPDVSPVAGASVEAMARAPVTPAPDCSTCLWKWRRVV